MNKMDLNKIYNESCIETMSRIDDKSIDLTMADFPYGINEEYDIYLDTNESLISLINMAMPEILRISKVAFITCGIANIFYYPKPTWIMCWVNSAGVGSTPWGFNCWQPILVYGPDPYLKNGLGRIADMIQTNEASDDNLHPCPKPLKFWSKLLHRGSINEGDLIYDPFMGSGTTAIVCNKYNRKWIGSEISKTYCELTEKRMVPYLQQQKLF